MADRKYTRDRERNPRLPRNINIIAVDFLHLWLNERGRVLSTATDIESLKTIFAEFFIFWLFQEYRTDAYIFEDWENFEFRGFKSESSLEDYTRLQKWVCDCLRDPPDLKTTKMGLFLAAKHITFDNCLFLLTKCPDIFGTQLLSIHGYFKDKTAPIKWNVNLTPYRRKRI